MQLICRNRGIDFDRWWGVFRPHAAAHEAAGLRLVGLWRGVNDPNQVFFLFRVDDRRRAEAFMSDPAAAEAGAQAGVLDGEVHFIAEAAAR